MLPLTIPSVDHWPSIKTCETLNFKANNNSLTVFVPKRIMSPENQWLEDVIIFLLKQSLFRKHVNFRESNDNVTIFLLFFNITFHGPDIRGKKKKIPSILKFWGRETAKQIVGRIGNMGGSGRNISFGMRKLVPKPGCNLGKLPFLP